MFCTNSHAVLSSIYFVVGDRLENAIPAKSFGKKKKRERTGLLKCRGKKDVWAEDKKRLKEEGGNERLHLGPDSEEVVREVPPSHFQNLRSR